jgi:hypothetical protein
MKQKEGIASVLLECEYLVGLQKKPIVVKLGFPSPSENGHEWACKYHLAGLRNSRVHAAYGVDGLQALTIAADAIRKRLDRLSNVTSETEPYEFVFPQFVPMSYGLEFHRHLCEVLRKEIEKKERQLSRKRLARKRPR